LRFVLLQIGKIASNLRRIRACNSPDLLLAVLSRGLDDLAIAAARHQAVLHLAGSREIAHKPDADHQQHQRNDQPDQGAAPVVAVVVVVGH
jgi:hypothetical protein